MARRPSGKQFDLKGPFTMGHTRAVGDVARGTTCEGCPALEDLTGTYAEAGGRFLVCPICFDAKHLDKG